MMTVGMLKNLATLVFLAFAISPFTAPFQTCDQARATVVAPLNSENDPGSLVSPLVTKAGRLTAAAAPPVGLDVSYVVPVAWLPPFTLPTRHNRNGSIRLTILRV